MSPVAIFDLDDTLLRGDSFARFVRALIVGDPRRLAMAVVCAPALVLLWGVAPLRVSASAWLWLATVGMGRARFAQRLAEHVEAMGAKAESVVVQPGIATVERHRAAGHRTVVATGCAEPLAHALCERLGIGPVEIVGSRLLWWAGGLLAAEHCYGAHKVRMLEARGLPPPWDFVYTDSARDLPLLAGGVTRHLVNPTTRSRRRVERALADSVAVLAWP